jgi:RecA-family ATPase
MYKNTAIESNKNLHHPTASIDSISTFFTGTETSEEQEYRLIQRKEENCFSL